MSFAVFDSNSGEGDKLTRSMGVAHVPLANLFVRDYKLGGFQGDQKTVWVGLEQCDTSGPVTGELHVYVGIESIKHAAPD